MYKSQEKVPEEKQWHISCHSKAKHVMSVWTCLAQPLAQTYVI